MDRSPARRSLAWLTSAALALAAPARANPSGPAAGDAPVIALLVAATVDAVSRRGREAAGRA